MKDYGSSLPASVQKYAVSCLDGVDWLVETEVSEEDDVKFLYSSSSSESLWQQAEPWIFVKPKSCKLIGAFFDKKLEFIDVVNKEIAPKRFIVGVQPSTVQVSKKIFSRDDISVVNSETMQTDNSTNQVSARYIHAKAMYFEHKEQPLVISGSANPSAPAWLRGGKNKNAEAVLVRLDEAVPNIAKELGFQALDKAEVVTVDDITSTPVFKSDEGVVKYLLIATISHGELSVTIPRQRSDSKLFLYQSFGNKPAEYTLRKGSENFVFRLDDLVIIQLSSAMIRFSDNETANLLLHFVDQIESLAVKGNKKKFIDALGTLDTDFPDFKVFFNCLDKVIFKEKEITGSKDSDRAFGEESEEKVLEGQSLVVSWDAARHGQSCKRKRIKASDELTLLLDTFVYGLNYDSSTRNAFSGEDEFGRNEEELIDSDDEELDEEKKELAETKGLSAPEKRELCSKRLKKIASKMCKGLESLGRKKVTHLEILPKLLAVVSLFKELNQRSLNFDWVGNKYPILPLESVEKLFADVCKHWWGAGYGLLLDKSKDANLLDELDELVRLRGHLVWIAAYLNLKFDLNDLPSEKIASRNQRLWSNSVYILLAQMIADDELVYTEATNICSKDSGERLKWVEELSRFGSYLKDLKDSAKKMEAELSLPYQNGWVIHKNESFKGVRYCHNAADGRVDFACVSELGVTRTFLAEKMLAV